MKKIFCIFATVFALTIQIGAQETKGEGTPKNKEIEQGNNKIGKPTDDEPREVIDKQGKRTTKRPSEMKEGEEFVGGRLGEGKKQNK